MNINNIIYSCILFFAVGTAAFLLERVGLTKMNFNLLERVGLSPTAYFTVTILIFNKKHPFVGLLERWTPKRTLRKINDEF